MLHRSHTHAAPDAPTAPSSPQLACWRTQDEELEPVETEQAQPCPAAKKQKTDYSGFKHDVARLQKNLQEFEQDLKEHSRCNRSSRTSSPRSTTRRRRR